MNDESGSLQITIPADAESVSIVRHAVSGLAEQAGMEPEVIADLKTVLTEACMNVVVHAYPDGPGRIAVQTVPEPDHLILIVTDSGTGIRPSTALAVDDLNPSLRLGLSLIASMTSAFSIASGPGRGTEVTMRLPLRADVGTNGQHAESPVQELKPAQVEIVAPEAGLLPGLLPVVLSRAVSAFGVQRDLPMERISDAMLLADEISTAAPRSFSKASVTIAISDGDGGIDLSIGPLDAEGATTLREKLRLPNGDGTVEAIADDVKVEVYDESTYVVFRIAGLDG